MVLVDSDRIREMFRVLMDVCPYAILRFPREELESREESNALIDDELEKDQLSWPMICCH